MRAGIRVALSTLLAFGVATANAPAAFQFEVLGVSRDWLVVRENIPARASDVAACRYPGLDPSEHVGARVHFLRLSDEAKRGRLVPIDTQPNSMPLYTRAAGTAGCTAPAESARRWREIVAHARRLGIELKTESVGANVLGSPVTAAACVLISRGTPSTSRCNASYAQTIGGHSFRIAVALTAVPESPDARTCQFVGHRLGVAVQVDGLDFGDVGAVAPGGFASHYDCRGQEFEPLRLYQLGGFGVLLVGFRGTSIADRREYPFVILFPTQP